MHLILEALQFFCCCCCFFVVHLQCATHIAILCPRLKWKMKNVYYFHQKRSNKLENGVSHDQPYLGRSQCIKTTLTQGVNNSEKACPHIHTTWTAHRVTLSQVEIWRQHLSNSNFQSHFNYWKASNSFSNAKSYRCAIMLPYDDFAQSKWA